MLKQHVLRLLSALAVCFALASCGSDPQPCNVADECVSQCMGECAPAPLASVACRGSACTCVCGTGGSGGNGGNGGTGGGGMSGAGGQ